MVDIAGSGSQIRMDAATLVAMQSHSDPSVSMSGQVGRIWFHRVTLPCADGSHSFFSSATVIDVAAKFVTYALWPDSAYSVVLSRSPNKCKISIGYHPWSPHERRHNIAAI